MSAKCLLIVATERLVDLESLIIPRHLNSDIRDDKPGPFRFTGKQRLKKSDLNFIYKISKRLRVTLIRLT